MQTRPLDADYREVATFLLAYEDFRRAILRRWSWRRILGAALKEWNPLTTLKQFNELRRASRQGWIDSGTHAGQLQRDRELTVLVRKNIAALATKEERSSRFFEIWMSEYPLDALRSEVRQRFPDIDLARVERLHSLYAPSFAKPAGAVKLVIASIWGAGTILLKTVPAGVVRSLGLDYDLYEVIVFVMIVGLLVYAALILIPLWIMRSRYVRYYESLSIYLKHLIVRQRGA